MSCPLCRSNRVTILVRDVPDPLHLEARYRIVRCLSCRIAFTDPVRDAYPAGYEPHQATRPRKRTTGTRAAILRTFYEGGGSPVERLLLALPWLAFRLRDRMKVRARDFYARPFRKRGRLLDIGSGAGNTLAAWKEQQVECVGVETDEATAHNTRDRLEIDVRSGTLEDQRFPDGSFDVVTLSHVIEHVPDPGATLREIRRVMRPAGELILWLPNFESPLRRIARTAWFPYEVPRHRWHFRPADLTRLLRERGFRTVEILPDLHEATFRKTARGLGGLIGMLLRRRRTRILLMALFRLFRRADSMRIRAVPTG